MFLPAATQQMKKRLFFDLFVWVCENERMLETLFENSLVWVFLVLWTLPWKGVALWKAAGQKEKKWFIALLVLNTAAILEILYIFYFGKHRQEEKSEKPHS